MSERSDMERTGMIAGSIACVLASLGVIFVGFVFVPIAAVVAAIGTYNAIKSNNMTTIGINVLAWVLVIAGLFTSPILLMMLTWLFK